jgi:hypothetical protein
MAKSAKTILIACLLFVLALIGLAYAQRPPDFDETGAPYLRVNINPTNVPPMVNINPNQAVPSVKVTEMPEIRFPPPAGCDNRRNYQTGVGRSISGPLMITYLHLPEQQTSVTLSDAGGSRSMNLGSGGQITTAIYLQANQKMDFGSDVMFSGCRPE